MGDKPEKTASPSTKSGVLPRVDQQEIRALYEGKKQPPTLPEMEDIGSITGTLIIPINEGEDKAKQADDPATGS